MNVLSEFRRIWKEIDWIKEQITKLPTRMEDMSGGSSGGGDNGSLLPGETNTRRIVFCHIADSKEELPEPSESEVERWHRARIDAGTFKGAGGVVDPDEDGWDLTEFAE